MNVIAGVDELEHPTKLWIVSRYFDSIGFMLAPFYAQLYRRLAIVSTRQHSTSKLSLLFYTTYAILLFLTFLIIYWVFFTDVVPSCLTPQGLTPFKKSSEYIIIGFFLLAAFHIFWRRAWFPSITIDIMLSHVLFAASDFCFTLYSNPFQVPNFLGHVFSTIAAGVMLKAVYTGLVSRPQQTLRKKTRFLLDLISTAPTPLVLLSSDLK